MINFNYSFHLFFRFPSFPLCSRPGFSSSKSLHYLPRPLGRPILRLASKGDRRYVTRGWPLHGTFLVMLEEGISSAFEGKKSNHFSENVSLRPISATRKVLKSGGTWGVEMAVSTSPSTVQSHQVPAHWRRQVPFQMCPKLTTLRHIRRIFSFVQLLTWRCFPQSTRDYRPAISKSERILFVSYALTMIPLGLF